MARWPCDLAAVGLEPVLARLARGRSRPPSCAAGAIGLVLQEEAAAVEIERDRWSWARISPGRAMLQDVAGTARSSRRRAGCSERMAGRHVDLHAQVPQAAEAGGDVERDVIVAAARRGTTARSRRPVACSASLLQRGRPVSSFSRLSSKRMPTFLRAWLSLVGLPQPGRFLEHHRLQVLVLLQAGCRARACSSTGRRRGGSSGRCWRCAGQGVGVKPVERLLGALVAGTPSGTAAPSPRTTTGCETICTVRLWFCSVFELPDLSSLVNSNFLVAGPRIGSGSDSVTRMRRESTGRKPSSPSETLAAGADGLVGQEAAAVGHVDAPGEACAIPWPGCRRPDRAWCCRAACPPTWLLSASVEGEPHLAASGGLSDLVGHLDGELDRVALAQEPRRVGLHHQVLGGDGVVFEEAAAQPTGRGRSPGTSTSSAPRAW